MQVHQRLAVAGLLMVTMASTAFIAATVTYAQADVIAPTRVEFVGTVEAVDATTVTVNGHVISLANSEIRGALTIGSIVKVEAMVDASGSFNATEVKSVTADDRGPQELELHGTVTAIDGTTFTVAGLTFNTLNARIEGNPQVGDTVEVKLMLTNGELTASKVETSLLVGSDDNGNDTLIGANNDDFGNDTLLGNDNIDDNGNDLGSANNDVLGNNDNIDDNGNDFGNDDNGNDLGGANNDAGNDDNGGQFGEDAKLIGTLEAAGDGFIIVNGQRIDVSGANIETALIVGSTVRVEVISVNGVLTASEVKNAADDNGGSNANNGGSGNDGGVSLNAGPGNRNDCGASIPDGWTGYRVRAGDTLSGIAATSGASTGDISSANCIDNPSRIRTGQTIVIPNGTALNNTPVVNNNSNSGSGNSGSGRNGNDDFQGNDDHGGQGNDDVLGAGNFDDNGGHGNDDGPGHDLGDDHGGSNGNSGSGNSGSGSGNSNSGSGNGGGSDDGGNHDSNDDNGGSSGSGNGGSNGGSSDDGGSHDNNDDNGSHGGGSGSGGSNSGGGHGGGSDDGGHGGHGGHGGDD